MISAETIARLRELEAKATKGPWEFRGLKDGDGFVAGPSDCPVTGPTDVVASGRDEIIAHGKFSDRMHSEDGANMQLIAALRNASPTLLSAAEENVRLREERARLIKQLRDLEDTPDAAERCRARTLLAELEGKDG